MVLLRRYDIDRATGNPRAPLSIFSAFRTRPSGGGATVYVGRRPAGRMPSTCAVSHRIVVTKERFRVVVPASDATDIR